MQLTVDPTEEEITQLRKMGVNTIVQVDGLTYLPGLGSTTSGYSVEALKSYNEFHRRLWNIQEWLNKNSDYISGEIKTQIGFKPTSLSFTLKLENGFFNVFEKESQCYLSF